MPINVEIPAEADGWQTVEYRHLIHQVRRGDGARRSLVEYRDGEGKLYGRWEVTPQVGRSGRPPLTWD